MDELKEIKERMDKVSHLEWVSGNIKSEDVYWLIEQAEKMDKFVYVNDKGEPKMTTKELMLLLMEFKQLQDENEELKNVDVERLKEYISQLEHENRLLYGRLNMIRDLTNKEIK